PYIQYEQVGADGEPRKKYVSLKEHDPLTVTFEEALELIRAKEAADASRLIREFPEAGIRILNGRWGPYITDGERNARVPKEREPESFSLDECRELLANAPPARGRWRRKTSKKAAGATRKKAAAEGAAGDGAAKRPAAKRK